MSGPLALVGGAEFQPGNEAQDRLLARAADGGRAFVLATAAARQRPDLAVEHARRWFAGLGLAAEELPATTRRLANADAQVDLARTGRLFYLVGGDPGLVPKTLAGTKVWEAVVRAWREGAALAGSSAGAMALGAWTLVRDRMPGDTRRRFAPALDLVPQVAVVPHFDTFGGGWVEATLPSAPDEDAVLLGLDERTAAVHLDGGWRAIGPGSVHVLTREGRRTVTDAAIEGLPRPRD
ncbi:MAG: Type 1 glutamine amidotransferase-like domain-containing protein [Planctomycetaceae bacterium]